MVPSERGEKNLARLLAGMAPQLLSGEYVFCTLPGSRYGDAAHLEPIAAVTETEGLTLVVPRERAAQAGYACEQVMRCISLTIHSDLEAVGLTAAVSTALAQQGISANVIAAYHHDHVFVPVSSAEQALEVLQALGS
jgi:hypothetical protein